MFFFSFLFSPASPSPPLSVYSLETKRPLSPARLFGTHYPFTVHHYMYSSVFISIFIYLFLETKRRLPATLPENSLDTIYLRNDLSLSCETLRNSLSIAVHHSMYLSVFISISIYLSRLLSRTFSLPSCGFPSWFRNFLSAWAN